MKASTGLAEAVGNWLADNEDWDYEGLTKLFKRIGVDKHYEEERTMSIRKRRITSQDASTEAADLAQKLSDKYDIPAGPLCHALEDWSQWYNSVSVKPRPKREGEG